MNIPVYEGSGQLHRVTQEELPTLLQWLEDHLPLSWTMYATVREMLRTEYRGNTIYSLDWPDIRAVAHGPVDPSCRIADYYSCRPRKMTVFSPSQDDACALLTWPGFLDWQEPLLFQAVSPAMADVIERLCKARQMGDDVTMRTAFNAMMVKPGELTSKVAPPGVTFRSLQTDTDLAWAHDTWHFRHLNSDAYLRELVKCFPSVVAQDQTGKYLGFEIGYEKGTIGMLYVIPEARGQGLGSYITCQMVQKYFQDGLPAMVFVEAEHNQSIKLHESLGFKKFCTVEFVRYKKNLQPMPGMDNN